MSSVSLKYCEIPLYLQHGQFYRSLNEDDPETTIDIPTDCFQVEREDLANIDEFTQQLRIMAFWILDEIPLNILSFCWHNRITSWIKAVLKIPDNDVAKLLTKVFRMRHKCNFDCIIKSSRMDILWFAVGRATPEEKKHAQHTLIAAELGNLPALELLVSSGFALHDASGIVAAEHNQLACLQYVHQHGCDWNSDVYLLASQRGHLRCLQYIHSTDLQWSADVSRVLAASGHLECLQYVLEQGCAVNARAVNSAARNGHLLCLQFLHVNNVPWNEDTCLNAACQPDVTILYYLHQNGCGWDSSTPSYAAQSGYIDHLKYAIQHHCPYDNTNIITDAARSGRLPCLQYLVEEVGVVVQDGYMSVFLVSLLTGNVECLKYLLGHHCNYLDVEFGDVQVWELFCYEAYFKADNPGFVRCVELAIEYGWAVDRNVELFMILKDVTNCKEFLLRRGVVL